MYSAAYATLRQASLPEQSTLNRTVNSAHISIFEHMNIYISHSTSFDYERELYLPLKNSPLYSLHHITLPHERSSEPFSTKNYLATCDLVIAECSYPSTGQGIELGWADILNVPIIAMYRMNRNISSSISRVTKVILSYSHIADAIIQIEDRLVQQNTE